MRKCTCMVCAGRKECHDKDKYKKTSCTNYSLIYKDIIEKANVKEKEQSCILEGEILNASNNV